MRIFITGGSGLLGQYLNIELNKHHEILTQYNSNIGNCGNYNSIQMQLTNLEVLESVFKNFKPDVVVHCAAIPNPEKADLKPTNYVYEVNVLVTQKIAEYCAKYGAKMIYTSTDLVYAGYRGSKLDENAKLIPVSLYAETKLMGEVKIKETLDNYVIARVALQIGFGLNHTTNNFHKTYVNLKNGKPVSLYTDQFRSPLALHETARIINELLSGNFNTEIINLSGSERVSRFELGELICECADFEKKLLQPTTMDDAETAYKVADVSLNNKKLRSLGIKIKSLKESIKESINQFEK